MVQKTLEELRGTTSSTGGALLEVNADGASASNLFASLIVAVAVGDVVNNGLEVDELPCMVSSCI